MKAVDVVLKLPEDLVQEAEAAGLLNDERIAEFLRAELERKRRIDELREDIRILRAFGNPPTPEEIAEEIEAARRE